MNLRFEVRVTAGDGSSGYSALGCTCSVSVHDGTHSVFGVDAPAVLLPEVLALAGRAIGEYWREGSWRQGKLR